MHKDIEPATLASPEEASQIVLPVDLSREEYIEFSLLVAKAKGLLRHYRELLLVTCGMILISVGALVYLKLRYGRANLLAVLLLLAFVLLVAVPLIRLPGNLRRSAGIGYDRTIQEGYRYEGSVYLEDTRIRKIGSSSIAAIMLDDKATLIGSRNMLIVVSPGSKAIVIPARFLSQENARAVTARLQGALRAENQHIFAPLQPGVGRTPAETESSPGGSAALLTLDIPYTIREFTLLLCDRALRTFLKRLPYIGLLSLVVGVLGAVMAGPLWGLAITVFVVVGFYLSVVEGGRLRAKRMAAATGEKERFLQLTLTDEGLVLRSRDGEERRLPWKAVRRAVARPDCVEFIAKELFIRIPKRCIPDMEALRKIADKHLITTDRGRK